MQTLRNIHLAFGGCITKEKIVVIPTVISNGSWKVMIMAAMKPKNIFRKYSKASLEKLSNNERMKVRILSILRK